MNPRIVIVSVFCVFATAAHSVELVDFNRDIRSILSENCFACHGPDSHDRKADLRLDVEEGALADLGGYRAIDRDNPAGSELLVRILTSDREELMPPPKSHKKLKKKEIALLKRWVEEGAPYEKHWAFTPPVKSKIPAISNPHWVRNAIDRFALAQLDEAGLSPMPEADRATMIRRVTLDLTGLPPTPADVDAFLRDSRPDAYERLVDRLLASEHYGERMALAWMDAARYGDTSVMHADGPRFMWPWRDWVINAYNSNKPFSDFLLEQVGGDHLEKPTKDQLVATGFNRNNATSDEGGAIPEELRVEYAVDRVKTTSNVFLGLSMECAQCHDHKYDPISQKDYYRFFAYFNAASDPGMQTRKGNQSPVTELLIGGDQKKAAVIDGKIAALNKKLDARMTGARDDYTSWMKTMSESCEPLGKEPDGLAFHLPLNDKGGDGFSEVVTAQTARVEGGKIKSVQRGTGRGVKFDGKIFGRIGVEPRPRLDEDKPFTISAWVRLANGSRKRAGAIASRMDKNSTGWDFYTQNGTVGIHLVEKWPDSAIKVLTKERLPENEWHHVAVSYDGSGKAEGVTIFVDGKAASAKVHADSLTGEVYSNSLFVVGGRDGKARFVGDAADLRIYGRDLDEGEIGRLCIDDLEIAMATSEEKRNAEQKKMLFTHYLENHDGPYQSLVEKRGALDTERKKALKDAIETSSMVMGDLPAKQMRETYILDRGQYSAPKKDEVITPGIPEVFPPLPEGAPANRLGLARWLLRDDHPLTARVAVNRYWSMFFGTGLVKTVMDFGNQGEMPSHPELLDWMARDFMDSGWDVKRSIRQIVTSATYRQSARRLPTHAELDPENRLLSRGPRFRLQGEFIRDQALAVSGLLNAEIGGAGVKPYQPPGLWNEVSLNRGLKFVQDKGDKLYRRSMYIYWKRSAPHPGMTIFDAPTREKCIVQRPRTNTPLQALYTLNDVQFTEAARQLAGRVLRDGGDTFEGRVKFLYMICTGRDADAEEISICRALFEEQLVEFRDAPEKAEAYLSQGESPRDKSLDFSKHAAWTVLAKLILNLDETLTRG